MRMPDFDVWSERVSTVLGQNPGPFTGPGTNTYLIGTSKRPLLLDTGIGLEVYDPLLEKGLAETKGATELQEIVLTHVHQDHIGGASHVRMKRRHDMRDIPHVRGPAAVPGLRHLVRSEERRGAQDRRRLRPRR
jgi:glyoxylase-like metal-dependent hydrolase (beta-lactamase superfamily II)